MEVGGRLVQKKVLVDDSGFLILEKAAIIDDSKHLSQVFLTERAKFWLGQQGKTLGKRWLGGEGNPPTRDNSLTYKQALLGLIHNSCHVSLIMQIRRVVIFW